MAPHVGSRYSFVDAIEDAEGRLYLTDREPYRFRSLPDTRVHRVVDGDTLFSLAGHYFAPLPRACGFWWAIADYQPEPIHDTLNSSGYVCDLKLVRDALGLRAGSALRKQGGDPNRSRKREDGELTRVSVIDQETGRRRVEFRRDGRVLGGEDPEARISHEVNEPQMSGTTEMMSATE